MEIKTKFNHGQRVQAIISGQEEYDEECPICEGKGEYIFKETVIECRNSGCYGNGFITKSKKEQWFVPKDSYYNFVIQKIGIELYNSANKKYSDEKSWIYYMSARSGTMFDENNLFSSYEDALEECNKRNVY